jgi:hypothetical protein
VTPPSFPVTNLCQTNKSCASNHSGCGMERFAPANSFFIASLAINVDVYLSGPEARDYRRAAPASIVPPVRLSHFNLVYEKRPAI